MVHKCCISSCGMSVRVVGAKGLSYHSFPTKEPNREKWLQAILPHVEKPEMFRIAQGYTRICSRHFKKKDYSMDSKKRARLSSNAVPSVFPGRDIRESSLSIKIENKSIPRKETSTKCSSVTISPADKSAPFLLPKDPVDDFGVMQLGTFESLPPFLDPSARLAVDHQPPVVSEDDTASSTFSSQEECHINVPTYHTEKQNGKIRKRRKHRASLPLSSSTSKKRSSTLEDLNIEGVGDALAEINLSALISVPSDLKQEPQVGSVKRSLSAALNDTLDEDSLLRPSRISKSSNASSFPESNEDEESIVASLDSVSLKKDSSNGLEQELLMSIQAVKIGPNERESETSGEAPSARNQISNSELDSLSRNPFIAASPDESQISGPLLDLYADLVNGGASLSLEDSSAIFDSQVLIDALQGDSEDVQAGTSLDQLSRNFSDSLLDCALPMSMLNMDDIHISDLVPFSPPSTKVDQNSSISREEGHAEPEDVEKAHPIMPLVKNGLWNQADGDASKKRNKDKIVSSDSSVECNETSSLPPIRNRKKSSKKEGSFSVERFKTSDKDILYYTGFETYEKFEAFYRSIESYVENLRVTDMVHSVTSMGLTGPNPDPTNPASKTSADFCALDNGSLPDEAPRRRLSQGRSMSRFDEMFMTIVRLRRKIPEKVLGHMFCVSQPSVSRIIRAWTMLLSKILDMLPLEEKSSSPGNSCSEKSTEVNEKIGSPHQPKKVYVGVPPPFRQLFRSDLAQTIISTGNVSLNSRKTSSSSATCPNISRSKRPKKDRLVVVVSEEFSTAVSVLPKDETFSNGIRKVDPDLSRPKESSVVNIEGTATELPEL